MIKLLSYIYQVAFSYSAPWAWQFLWASVESGDRLCWGIPHWSRSRVSHFRETVYTSPKVSCGWGEQDCPEHVPRSHDYVPQTDIWTGFLGTPPPWQHQTGVSPSENSSGGAQSSRRCLDTVLGARQGRMIRSSRRSRSGCSWPYHYPDPATRHPQEWRRDLKIFGAHNLDFENQININVQICKSEYPTWKFSF